MAAADPSPDDLSALLGAIYGAALDPAAWPAALRRVCEAMDCADGRLALADTAAGTLRLGPGGGRGGGWPLGATAAAARAAAAHAANDADAPFIVARGACALAPEGDWGEAVNLVLLREGPRLGLFSALRPAASGATDRAPALLRLLAPHLRRAVALGDALDAGRREAAALRGALDGLAVGVGLVAADGALVHANAAARAMLADAGGPIRAGCGGRLAAARRPAATAALRAAIAGGAPAAVPLTGGEGGPEAPPAVAHVLPLAAAGGAAPAGAAAAAVYVAAGGPAPGIAPEGLDAAARGLGLTPAEARLLARLAAGDTPAQARQALGIGTATAKTHLLRIFAKAGVSRQAELAALLGRLLPPVRAAG